MTEENKKGIGMNEVKEKVLETLKRRKDGFGAAVETMWIMRVLGFIIMIMGVLEIGFFKLIAAAGSDNPFRDEGSFKGWICSALSGFLLGGFFSSFGEIIGLLLRIVKNQEAARSAEDTSVTR
ncbi:MAG: hypothetical protein IJR99_01985 [Kiritimatiellae bacterium]|nr:hypothetical protein [Kiritimatiellia bacterium]